jgi:hypothetical protein
MARLPSGSGERVATWASFDFGIIGTALQIVGESPCEAVDLHAGERRRGRGQRQTPRSPWRVASPL